ncbi:unnamed protein product [Diatraea saccharalis]|uniref:Uncharacterized protein n=1 Tax=Diatraea saccharalis TaxID=40085 RepID=A0A9N9R0R6_9NEOP|nr:unnamed protein product [Diatraea saccharalis]
MQVECSHCGPKHCDDLASCDGDRNATSGCGNHCGNYCSDYKEVNKTCLTGCRGNSCDCKPGYVYHDTLLICVLPTDCYLLSRRFTTLVSYKSMPPSGSGKKGPDSVTTKRSLLDSNADIFF